MKQLLFAALEAHDDLLARRSVEVWIGGEPTFTRRGLRSARVDERGRGG